MPLDTSIAMGYKPVQVPNQLASYAQMQQILGGQQEQQLNALKMQEAQATMQERNALRGLNPDAEDYESQLFRVNPALGIQYRKERTAAEASGAATAASKAARLTSEFELKAKQRKFGEDLKRGLSANPSDANIVAFGEDAVLQGLYTPDQVQATVSQLLAMPVEERARILSQAGATANELRPQVVAPGASLVTGNKAVFTAPEKTPVVAPTNLAKLQTELAALPLGDPRRTQYEALIRKEITHAPGTTVHVSTEKKYGEAFGSKIADVDIGKMTTAEKAPQLAESANRIIDIVNKGDVFTGPAADIKLNIARALNVAGASNEEKIANTESLVAATGQSTLDSIKGAGLGTGQGFTDKDLKFLQGIAGGTIALTKTTLTDLATLQHRVAARSAEAWNKRVKEMPSEVLKGTGISTTPITVPSLSSKKSAGPNAGTVQDGYRFKGGDPANKANWEKQ